MCFNKDIIELVSAYLGHNNNDSFRLCSQYFNLIIAPIYFSHIFININKINKNKHLFRSFVHKYNLKIRIKNVQNNLQLAYLNSFNIIFISTTQTFIDLYHEYIIPPTVKHFIFQNIFIINKSILKFKVPRPQLYDCSIRMSLQNFKETCKYMININKYVQIKIIDNQVSFICDGDNGVSEIIFNKQQNVIDNDIIQGVFKIKNLIQIFEYAQSDDIEIFIKNNCSLVIKFGILILGNVFFYQSSSH